MLQPINLYYWPTPNGKKVAIFLEEAELPTIWCPLISPLVSSLTRSTSA
jgi:hypothetical protein